MAAALGLLQVTGAANAWGDVPAGAGPFLPVFDAASSPGVADAVAAAAGRPYRLAPAADVREQAAGPLATDR